MKINILKGLSTEKSNLDFWKSNLKLLFSVQSAAEYIGESGKGGERNMKRARREKIYEKSMRIV